MWAVKPGKSVTEHPREEDHIATISLSYKGNAFD
jgi:hypothetical protein